MLDIIGSILTIYCFAFLTGLGLSTLIVPNFLRRPLWYLSLAPGVGLLQLAIVSSYLIASSQTISAALPYCAISGLVTVLTSCFLARRAIPDFQAMVLSELRELKRMLSWQSLVAALVLTTLLAPVLQAQMPTTPYRVGIDQVGYAESAQYLVEGGTYDKLQTQLLEELHTTDLHKAKIQNAKLVHLNLNIDSEFILKAMRWGFPGTVAALTLLTHSGHVYKVEFIMLIWSYALLFFIAISLLRIFLAMPLIPTYFFAAALLLNCNLINVAYEGQLAQIFTTPYVALMFLLYAYARTLPDDASRTTLTSEKYIRSVCLFAFVLAGLFCAYNEVILLILGFFYCTLIADFCLTGRSNRTAMLFIPSGLVIGFAVVPFISSKWLYYTFANLNALGQAGFWQPHWGSFAEILGLLDMYKEPGYALLARSPSNAILNITVSLLIAAILGFYLATAKKIDRSFWLAAPLLTLAAYVKFSYMDAMLNYAYMKVYTLLLPLTVCAVFAAFYHAAQRLPKLVKGVHYIAAAVVILTGAGYIHQYLHQDGTVTADMYSLYNADEKRNFSDVALYMDGNAVKQFMLAPLIQMNWINVDGSQKFIAPYLSYPVDVILANNDLTCRSCFLKAFPHKATSLNASYVLLRTGLTVSSMCTSQAPKYTIDSLGDEDNRQQWTGLPAPQCDYTYVHQLPYVRKE